jgi:cell division septation protein DedD
VKTVKVLADGTIVTGEATAPMPSAPAVDAGVPSLAVAPPQASAPVEPPQAQDEPPQQLAMADSKMTQAPVDSPPDGDEPAPAMSATQADPALVAIPPSRPKKIATSQPKPHAATAPASVPSQVVGAQTMKVASLQAPAPVAPSATGAWTVQISSQKSQSDAIASFQALQRRHAATLSGLKPSIKQADLGDKGTYYRVRVGSWASRDAATAFCVKLKATGGDCVVVRN